LTRKEQEVFLTTLRELKFPTNYMNALSNKIWDGKLRGLKTHDYHILLEQVTPLHLRNIGNPKVVGAIMRIADCFAKFAQRWWML